MKNKSLWTNIRIPLRLAEEIDEYIKNSKEGFTSRSDFVKAAVREKLNRLPEDINLIRDLIDVIKKGSVKNIVKEKHKKRYK